ncbi:hypothetical protein DB30_05930 [Enhygromyxa salina]|uniref:Uncharacterized protein n=1 Tax=Enhygromyxa salina TaxID=215803 RepID=A0A0C2D786_9BACT|nr:hypothetical protein [Enhygromyxa salina]KIG19026.1 hypothetical protein DB30_05930 [Enhygromyxa salina]
MTRLSTLVFASLVLLACKGDDASEQGDGATGAPEDSSDDGATSETDSGDPVCFPEGTYGPCSTNMGCQCVLGGDLYQACTRSCTDVSDCGEMADFPGATPACVPVNPGETDMICALQCTSDADCPCGLECQGTYLICTEPQ